MSEMVERVRLAIVAKMAEPSPIYETPEQISEQIARAAIKAIREPTAAMQKAGFSMIALHSPCNCDQVEIYQAMIDEALK